LLGFVDALTRRRDRDRRRGKGNTSRSMSLLLTATEMHRAEAAALEAGTPEPVLMRRAAEQIATWIDRRVKRPHRRFAIALVGPGNNGGDALVALSILNGLGWRAGYVPLGRAEPGTLPAEPSALQSL